MSRAASLVDAVRAIFALAAVPSSAPVEAPSGARDDSLQRAPRARRNRTAYGQAILAAFTARFGFGFAAESRTSMAARSCRAHRRRKLAVKESAFGLTKDCATLQ